MNAGPASSPRPSAADAAVELLLELVAIDSVNPGLVPGAAGESRIVEHLTGRLAASGFEATRVDAAGADDRPSLVAVPRRTCDGPTVVLNGHLDTVGVEGMDEPFTPRRDGDRLLGRGTADMKGGVAAMVAAAEHLVGAGAPVRPVLALVADEEDASLGTEAVLDRLDALGVDPDVCLVGEPTDLARCTSLRGFAVVRVTFAGRAAHSSQADLGVNAVTHLGRLLHAVDVAAPGVRAAGGDLVVTLAQGGRSAFVVPDHASCLVELRTTPEQSAADAVALVADLVQGTPDVEVELVVHRDGWRLDGAGPAPDLADALASALGEAGDFAAPYWMEASLWQQRCPTLVCGPSGGGLHAVDEWVDLGQVRRLADALVEVLNGWRPGAD